MIKSVTTMTMMTKPKRQHAYGLRAGALAVSLALLASCSPIVNQRGNLVDDARLARVEVGQMNRVEVLNLLGTPTSRATFDDDTWYYIGQVTEKTAFFNPEVVERRIIKLQFDTDGTLVKLDELTLEDAQEVDTVDRETPTLGRELGALEQLLGNLGRFNPGGEQ
jgi:Small protein A (tmRNA-binding)